MQPHTKNTNSESILNIRIIITEVNATVRHRCTKPIDRGCCHVELYTYIYNAKCELFRFYQDRIVLLTNRAE